jgi:SMODS domain-containing protein
MTTSEAFLQFKSNLELPDKQFEKASAAQQKIRTDLAKYLTIENSFLSGSYARYTKIDPLKDIDIIIVRNTSRVPLSTGGGIGPSEALNQVAAAVSAAYPNAAITYQSRSINVQIPGVSFGFDLVPAWLRTPDGYRILAEAFTSQSVYFSTVYLTGKLTDVEGLRRGL